ncbi:MAG TPA: sulfurtransferase TusA family protein [Bacillota bacterium]|jgi:TusA-related sulfurtransferase
MSEYRIDAVGDVCPVPLLKVQRAALKLAPGDLLVVEVGQPRTVRNVVEWAGKNGFSAEIRESAPGVWQLDLRAAGGGRSLGGIRATG